MSLTAEAITTIAKLAEKGQETQVTPMPGDDKRVMVTIGGDTKMHDIPPPLLKSSIMRLPDLAVALEVYKNDKGAIVYHNEAYIKLLPSCDDTRESIVMRLPLHEQFQTLQRLTSNPHPVGQRQMVALLSHDLKGVLDDEVLVSLRGMEFRRDTAGHAGIDHGKESLGQSVEAAVVSTHQDVPEFFTATVQVYAVDGLERRQCVRLHLEIDVEQEKFSLRALPGELTVAMQNAQSHLRDVLVGILPEGTPIVEGTP